ncbi:hypothetical protein TNCV_3647831 [Trichonephila clavipes]|nr:hypothetical protein TNCV_3647831 [Trichonephila clavipes]
MPQQRSSSVIRFTDDVRLIRSQATNWSTCWIVHGGANCVCTRPAAVPEVRATPKRRVLHYTTFAAARDAEDQKPQHKKVPFWYRLMVFLPIIIGTWTATAGSDVVESGRPIFEDFFQHLRPHIGNNAANVVFQIVKRLWLIRIDQ